MNLILKVKFRTYTINIYKEITLQLLYLIRIMLEIFLNDNPSTNFSTKQADINSPSNFIVIACMCPLEDCPSLGITLTFRDYFLTALSCIDSPSNSSVVATFTAIGTSKSRGVFYFGILWLYSIALEINLNQIKLPPERIANIMTRTHLV